MNLSQLLVGAILGQCATGAVWGLRRYYAGFSERKRKRAKVAQRDTMANSRWLVNYYAQSGEIDSLYDCRIMNYETKIPFITKPEWGACHTEDLTDTSRSRFAIVDGNADFPIDAEVIARRKSIGQSIWPDSRSVYLDRVEFPIGHGAPAFVLKACSYYQILSNMFRIEDETFRNVRTGRVGRTPVRSKVLPNAATAIRLRTKPFGLGGAVAIILKSGNDFHALIHDRSESLATYPGAKAMIPNFGFEPIVNHGLDVREGLLRYNFLKEYAEELFDYEDLVNAASSRQIDPLWFYEISNEVRHLRSAIRDGLCTMTFLGFGFDCLNGVPIVSYVALIESPEVITDIATRTHLNWEGSGIRLVNLDRENQMLQNWLRDGLFHPGAAYTLARALQYLERTGIWRCPR